MLTLVVEREAHGEVLQYPIWQTFGLTGKIEINEKTCQNAKNKQTFGVMRYIVINEINLPVSMWWSR